MNLQLNELSALCWRCFGDEWVVFNEGSGGTIVADPITAATLMALEAGWVDQAVLQERIAGDFQIDDSEKLNDLLSERVESLLAMSWIESEN